MAGKSLGTLTLDLILKMGGFEQGMDKAARLTDKRMREMEARAKKFGVAIGAAVAAGAVAVAAGVKSAIDYADQLNDMNQRLGVSAEALSGWAYAAKQSGTDIDALGVGLKKLAKNMAEALDPKSQQAGLFEALGVSVKDAEGRLRDVEDVLPEIASKFKDLDNATQESALAMDLFGKSGTDLLEFLNQGADGIADLRKEAEEYGQVLSGETLRSADQFNDNLQKMQGALNGAWNEIAKGMLPQLVDMTGELAASAKQTDSLRQFGEGLATVLGGLGKAFGFVSGMARQFGIDAAYTVEVLTVLKNAQASFLKNGNLMKLVPETAAKVGQAGVTRKELLDQIKRAQANAKVEADIARLVANGVAYDGPLLEGGQKKSDSGLAARLAAAYGSPGSSGKKGGGAAKSMPDFAEGATKALREQIEATIAAREEFDSLAASLSGPLAEAAYRYSVEQQRLNDLAKEGEVDTAALAQAQADLRKEYDDNVESIKQQLDPLGELLKDLEFENSLLGMTNAEREVAIATRGMDAKAIAGQSAALAKLKDAFANGEQMREQIGLMEEFRDSVGGIFSDIRDGASAWDAVKDAFDNFADAIFDFASKKVMEQLFGQMGTSQTGSAGGWISALLGAFSGSGGGFAASSGGVSGQAFADVFSNGGAFGFASGGLMPGNSFARVNELGPELMTVRGRDYLMTGNDAVTITPNHKLGGANGSVSVTQVFNNPRMYDRSTSAQREAEAARKLKDSMRFA